VLEFFYFDSFFKKLRNEINRNLFLISAPLSRADLVGATHEGVASVHMT
jgi:hypothetical protein